MDARLDAELQGDRHPTREAVFDRIAIRELLENWIIWRDSGDWERFATVWRPGARMNATWFQAPAEEFIEGSRRSFEGGMKGLHTLGGSSIEVNRDRAVAQSRMQITHRSDLDGITVDVVCQGRFVDALEKHEGRWGLVHRQPVYELDRMVPVDGGAELKLDADLLGSFPEGYRHLAYIQTKLGFQVSRTLPGTRGPEIAALMDRMVLWLEGAEASCLDGTSREASAD